MPEWYENKRFVFKHPPMAFLIMFFYAFILGLILLFAMWLVKSIINIDYFDLIVGSPLGFLGFVLMISFISAMVALMIVLAVHGTLKEKKSRFLKRVGITKENLLLEFDDLSVISIPWDRLRYINYESVGYLDDGKEQNVDLGMLDRRTLHVVQNHKKQYLSHQPK